MGKNNKPTIVDHQDVNLEFTCMKKLSLPARGEMRKAIDDFKEIIESIARRDAERRRKS